MTGMEPFIDPVAGGLVGILVDVAKTVGGGFAQAVGDRSKAATALKRYAARYAARYGEVRLLGMKREIQLESIYTKVRFLDELRIRHFASLEALEDTYRRGQKRRFQFPEQTRLDSSVVVNEKQYLMVLGGPGAGKSTFLRRTGLEALKGGKGSFKHNCIPVLLELKRFNSDTVDVTKAITDELVNFGFPETDKFAINLLVQGKLLILLDGMDEVPKANQNAVIDAIQSFVNRYDENRYIASCRIASYRSTWNRFRDIEIADFDDDQIQQFVYNWFQSDLDKETRTAEKCLETLNDSSYAAAKELAQTPLLLTFLCMVYDRTQGFPTNRATLYRKALDILLEEWAAEKRVRHETIYEGLNPDLEKVLLSEISYNGFTNDQLFFTQQELVKQIKTFLSDTVDKPKYLDGKAVLDAIAIQQGILVERAEDIFSFSHLTLQEYLTAQYLSQDFEIIKSLVEANLIDRRWREVFILISGSLQNSDKLIELMALVSRRYINSSSLETLITWIDSVTTDPINSERSAIKRVIALSLSCTIALQDSFKEYLNPAFVLARSLDPEFKFSDARTSGNLQCSHTESLGLSVQPLSSELECSQNFSDLLKSHIMAIARALAKDLALGRVLAIDRALILAYELEKLRIFKVVEFTNLIDSLRRLKIDIPEQSQSHEANQEFVNQIYDIWLRAFHCQKEWVDLADEEIQSLSNYLYINELMVTCKKAAVRVSEKVWKNIEEEMLIIKTLWL